MYNRKLIDFYKGKNVLITGHTGFKGSWMCKLLSMVGAHVIGYALNPPTNPALFDLLELSKIIDSEVGDISDLHCLKRVFEETNPDIVIHMAAQPIVRESYYDPVVTYRTNVMGTVNVLECVRHTSSVRSFLNVTTDKVYLNKEWEWGYRENEELNGYDPYSNSKSCSELITSCYRNSFFSGKEAIMEDIREVSISTARAGNVIGGGDFATDRIIPDCVRAVEKGEDIIVRNPYSTRPYEHVLEPIVAYLIIAKAQYEDKKYAGSYNVGPDDLDCWSTGNLVDLFCDKWNKSTGSAVKWINQHDGGPHEANFLKLDCSKIRTTFGWSPKWNVAVAMDMIIEWTKAYLNGDDIEKVTRKQINDYLS